MLQANSDSLLFSVIHLSDLSAFTFSYDNYCKMRKLNTKLQRRKINHQLHMAITTQVFYKQWQQVMSDKIVVLHSTFLFHT